MKIEELLLSWDEYNNKDFTVPYIFSIQKGGQKLLYFGVRHSFDPQDKQFEKIRQQWKNFLGESEGGKRVVVIESHIPDIIPDEQETILRRGEVGFAALLAHNADCPFVCFEPNIKEIYNALAGKFTREEFIYHDFAQVAYQWNNLVRKPDFAEYVGYYLEGNKEELGWTDFDFTFENIKKIHREKFGGELDINAKQFYYNSINPSQKNGVINEVSRQIDVVRDTRVVEGIKSEWGKGNSIFVVYGSGHSVIQEPALRKLLI